MRKISGFMLVALSVVGCVPEAVDESDESGDEITGTTEDAINIFNAIAPNAIAPNAIAPNAIAPNAIAPNALTAAAIPSSTLSALQDPGEAGRLSRLHVKYAVSCAFDSSHSFSFTWTDSNSVPHEENYVGALALAPDWVDRGLTEPEQRWVSACMAARTNYYESTVLISMRGSHSSLTATEAERSAYSAREGAFWGNIFASTPKVHACYDAQNVDHSRSKLRDCAAGHVDGGSTVACGIIQIVGACGELIGQPAAARCTAPDQSGDGFPSCAQSSEVVTTFLPP